MNWLWLRVVIVSGALMLTGCDQAPVGEQNSPTYQHGLEAGKSVGESDGKKEGYRNGYSDGEKAGHEKGYEDGFATAVPAAKHVYSSFERSALRVVAGVAAIKILLAILFTSIALITSSDDANHIAGKMIMGIIGGVGAFFGDPSLGVSAKVSHFMLAKGPETIWAIVLGACVAGYGIIWVAARIAKLIEGPKVEGLCVLLLTALTTIFARTFIDFFESGQPEGYLGSSILIGLLLGGLFYLAMGLLEGQPIAIRPKKLTTSS